MTSELRELVWVPKSRSASRSATSRPRRARARAQASPTTPPPTTTQSIASVTASIYRRNEPPGSASNDSAQRGNRLAAASLLFRRGQGRERDPKLAECNAPRRLFQARFAHLQRHSSRVQSGT